MATLIQSIGVFSDVFNFFLPFLLVFSVAYAILAKTKVLTEDANINAVISFVIALIVSLSGAADFIMQLTPFMATFFIIIFFVILIFLFFGVKLEDVMKSKTIIILLVAISAIFVFYVLANYTASMATVTPQGIAPENATNVTVKIVGTQTCSDLSALSGPQAAACIIGNPRFLSVIVLLGIIAIATFAVLYKPQ